MLKLNSARILQAIMAGAVATTAPSCVVGYSDKAVAGAGYDGDAKLTDLNGVTAVTICAAPAASTSRHIDYISLRNNDSAEVTVTIRYNQSSTLTTVVQATLAAGEMLGFTHGDGWYVNNADGSRKSGALQDLSSYATTAAVAAGYQALAGFADNEVPAGAIDGNNATFILGQAPSPAASLQLFRNGVLQRPMGVDYTLADTTLIYVIAPSLGDTHVCWYRF